MSGINRKKRLKLLRRRIDFLDRRIAESPQGYKGDSYDVAEAFALEWVLQVTAAAMDVGSIYALEEHDLGPEYDFVVIDGQEGEEEDGVDR